VGQSHDKTRNCQGKYFVETKYLSGKKSLSVADAFIFLINWGRRYVACKVVSFINCKVMKGLPTYFLSVLLIAFTISKMYFESMSVSQYAVILSDDTLYGKANQHSAEYATSKVSVL